MSFYATESGSLLSKNANIYGSNNISLGSKCIINSNATLRGDLRRSGSGTAISISIDSSCVINSNSVIKPPYRLYKNIFSYYPVRIGKYVLLESDSLLEAAQVGSFVHIESGCVIGQFSVIYDYVLIEKDTIVPPFTIIPPYSHVVMEKNSLVFKELPLAFGKRLHNSLDNMHLNKSESS